MGRKVLELKARELKQRRFDIRHKTTYFERLGEPPAEADKSHFCLLPEQHSDHKEEGGPGNGDTEGGRSGEVAKKEHAIE